MNHRLDFLNMHDFNPNQTDSSPIEEKLSQTGIWTTANDPKTWSRNRSCLNCQGNETNILGNFLFT